MAGSEITFTLGTAPSSPASGKVMIWANSSSGLIESKNSSGAGCFAARSVGAAFSGAGSALTSGTSPGVSLIYLPPLAFAGVVIAWTVTVDGGTAGFRVWRKAAGTAVPTVSDTITSADLAISTGTNLRSTTFTNFSGGVAPTFTAGDIIAIQLNAAATATFATFSLQVQ